MKGGLFFFLKCGKLIIVIRGALIVSFVLMFYAPKTSLLFPIMIVISGILIFANIATMRVREPKEKEVLDFIAEGENKYVEKVKFEVGLIGNSRVHTLRAYSPTQKLNLSRQVGYDVMYSKLCTVVAIENSESVMFCANEVSLLKNDGGAETVHWKLERNDKCLSVESNVYDEGFKISELKITNISNGEVLTILAKDDFHLREILGVINDNIISK